jgi:hypothetical protein
MFSGQPRIPREIFNDMLKSKLHMARSMLGVTSTPKCAPALVSSWINSLLHKTFTASQVKKTSGSKQKPKTNQVDFSKLVRVFVPSSTPAQPPRPATPKPHQLTVVKPKPSTRPKSVLFDDDDGTYPPSPPAGPVSVPSPPVKFSLFDTDERTPPPEVRDVIGSLDFSLPPELESGISVRQYAQRKYRFFSALDFLNQQHFELPSSIMPLRSLPPKPFLWSQPCDSLNVRFFHLIETSKLPNATPVDALTILASQIYNSEFEPALLSYNQRTGLTPRPHVLDFLRSLFPVFSPSPM